MNENFYEELKLKKKILPYFKEDDGHGFDHTQRVYRNALIISDGEDVDLDIVKASALLHDIARHKETDENGLCHAEEGAKMAREILEEVDFSKEKIERVIHCIEVHRFSKGLRAETCEAEILQDADRLDALGAMVLVRMIKYNLERNIPIHEPKIPMKEEYEGYKNSTVINHIHEKILKIKPDTFKTKKAQEIAKERYKLVKDFAESYVKEVNGEI